MNLQNNNNPQPPSKEDIQKNLDIISLANETSVLMSVLCEKLGLTPNTTTHQQFVEAFTTLQKNRLDSEKYMQEQFMLSNNPKTRKKRTMQQAMEEPGGLSGHAEIPVDQEQPVDWEE